MKRKVITLLLVFVLAFSAVGAIAESANVAMARTIAIQRVTPKIVKAGSLASCSSKIIFSSAYTVDVTITLEQSPNNSSWTSFRSWDIDNVANDTTYTKSAGLDSGYYYRTTVTASAFNGSTFIETVVVSSASIYY